MAVINHCSAIAVVLSGIHTLEDEYLLCSFNVVTSRIRVNVQISLYSHLLNIFF